jgi:hypothetical protein
MKGQDMGAISPLPSGFLKICRMISKHAGLPETVVAQTAGIGLNPPEDHMIVQVDIDRVGGLAELAGLCEVPDYVKPGGVWYFLRGSLWPDAVCGFP